MGACFSSVTTMKVPQIPGVLAFRIHTDLVPKCYLRDIGKQVF